MIDRDTHDESVVTLRIDVLWVDFQTTRPEFELQRALASRYRLVRCWPNELALYDQATPGIIVMECDTPDELVLKLLQALKQKYPRSPIIMVAEALSLDVAMWALKARVWDLLQKPLDTQSLNEVLDKLDKLFQQLRQSALPRVAVTSSPAIPNLQDGRLEEDPCARLRPALNTIHSGYQNHISEQMLAQSCTMSVHHFSRLFRKLMGLPMQEYLVQVRLQAAARLLLDTETAISTVAFNVGFNDSSYFSRAFKKQYQLSPSQFRASRGNRTPELKLVTNTPAK